LGTKLPREARDPIPAKRMVLRAIKKWKDVKKAVDTPQEHGYWPLHLLSGSAPCRLLSAALARAAAVASALAVALGGAASALVRSGVLVRLLHRGCRRLG